MAYRFKLKEALQDGVRRIAVEQLDRVSSRPRGDEQRAVWVHETRKALKRARALLRCARSGLQEQVWGDENAALRDIARRLSGLRDRHVAQATMAKLAGRDEALDAALAWLAGSLAGLPTGRGERQVSVAISKALAALGTARERLAKIEVAGNFTAVIGEGLARCQSTGRHCVERLERDSADESLHELRKAVQTYQRQQTLVQLAWPELQSVRIDAARALAVILGDAQDFSVLAALAVEHAGTDTVSIGNADRIVAACQERQADLRGLALPAARRLFGLRPRAVRAELAIAWGTAMALGKASSLAQSAHPCTKR